MMDTHRRSHDTSADKRSLERFSMMGGLMATMGRLTTSTESTNSKPYRPYHYYQPTTQSTSTVKIPLTTSYYIAHDHTTTSLRLLLLSYTSSYHIVTSVCCNHALVRGSTLIRPASDGGLCSVVGSYRITTKLPAHSNIHNTLYGSTTQLQHTLS